MKQLVRNAAAVAALFLIPAAPIAGYIAANDYGAAEKARPYLEAEKKPAASVSEPRMITERVQ